MTTEISFSETLSAAQEALERGAWEEARAQYQRAIALEESPEAFEGLGTTAMWLGDHETMFSAQEQAYRLYQRRGDRAGAARVATRLAVDYMESRGEEAVAKGWLRRAKRLLDGAEPTPEQGWTAIWDGLWSLPDTTATQRLGLQAAALGRSLGVVDLEMAGLALEGLAMVSEGNVSEGMLRLDEATAAAVAGEMSDPKAGNLVCCFLIYGCELIRDFDRAAQWCQVMEEFCTRWNIRPFFAYCRTHYSGVLLWHGDWDKAEAELAEATKNLQQMRPALAGDGTVRLAELRRRQGRLEEAADLFKQVEYHTLAHIGLAALALDQNNPQLAADLAERFLRRIPAEDRTERAAGLELLVQAQLQVGAGEQARSSLEELKTVTDAVGTMSMRAAALFSEGLMGMHDGEYDFARKRFEDAVDFYMKSGAPFETARSRTELAKALSALGRYDAAQNEAQVALTALERMGALSEASRARGIIDQLQQHGKQPASDASTPSALRQGSEPALSLPKGQAPLRTGLGGLTPREIEVLQLIAQGLSNQEIAQRLVLSQHTVHRHVANILTKLDQPSRAAAAAYAVRNGLT